MTRLLFSSLFVFALTACGDKEEGDDTAGSAGADGGGGGYCGDANACCDYVNAVLGCYEQLGYDVTMAGIDETACTGYDAAADPYFTCLAEVWNGYTCENPEDISNAATQAATECVAG